MSKLSEIFNRALSPFTNNSNSQQAYNDLKEGKKISLNMNSDRYTYDNREDNKYDKKWTPKTKEEKETLSPRGYYRQGDRESERKSIMSGIFNAALNRAKNEDQERVNKLKSEGKKAKRTSNKKLTEMAEKEAEEQFNNEYREKQISVPSTAIKNIQYDPDTEGLTVQFTSSGKKYFYPAVPLELVQALMKAPSKGEFFMKNIHDQYSMYGKDHSKKDKKQQKGIKTYMKSYVKNNKGKWTK